MRGEHCNKCDICKSKGNSLHARVFFRMIDNKRMWLCKICWDNQPTINDKIKK